MFSAKRINWAKKYPNLPELNLINVQKDSWQKFLKTDLQETLQSISPITDYTGNNWELSLNDLYYDPIVTSPETAKHKELNYTVPIKNKAKLTHKRTGTTFEENVFLLNFHIK